jgi:hypothetical protein
MELRLLNTEKGKQVKPFKCWPLSLITPSKVTAREVKLNNFQLLETASKRRHQTPIQTIVTFVFRFVNEIEISTH